MPTLDWIGKKAVLNHHNEVPFHLLRCDPARSIGEEGGNLLVQGDNLLALKALLPYYAGQVKCIYIDPPYNTGNEDWVYNDNVNSPEIRDWLGKVVGGEAEDLSRHDKWLCMMFPRMKLLVQFLRPDGFLFVSLDEIEITRFRLMMEDIVPPSKYVTTLIWKSRRNLDNRSLHNVSIDHEYVLAFRMGSGRFRGAEKDLSKYSNPDNDPRGPWMSDNLVGLATIDRRPNLHYELINPETGIAYKCPDKGWRYSQETMAQKIAENRILWPKSNNGRPRHKKFLNDLQDEFAGFSSFIECGNTNEGTEEMSRIMGRELFIFPKPRSLVETLIAQTTSEGDLILDCFAGTGTTGHAVYALNSIDNGRRRFIMIELDKNVCETITSERLRKVISGYSWVDPRGTSHEVSGIGNGFRYCELGPTLFDASGEIRSEVTFLDLARHVFFTETGQPLPEIDSSHSPLIGSCNNSAIYLLYNGVMRDAGNTLTLETLELLPPFDGPKVIYADGCLISPERLRQSNITFKQIPYQIRIH